MKSLIVVVASLFALSASAAFELRGKFERTNCTIKNNKVIRIEAFGKENTVGFSQVTDIQTFGVEEILTKAQATAQDHSGQDREFIYEATLNGKTFDLHIDDSKEAMAVVRMIVKACRFQI